MKPRLIVEQKITAFVNKYNVYGADASGNKLGLAALAQQKRLAFKEKVLFYADEQKSQVAFTFRAEKVMDIHGRYFVEDGAGNLVGMFRKEFKQSLVVSTWRIMDPAGNDVFIVKESDEMLAILRRFGGMIPIIGDLIELVVMFLKYHFVFVDSKTGQEVGKYTKTTLFRDHYILEMTDEGASAVDWRVLSAMCVGLDALQSR